MNLNGNSSLGICVRVSPSLAVALLMKTDEFLCVGERSDNSPRVSLGSVLSRRPALPTATKHFTISFREQFCYKWPVLWSEAFITFLIFPAIKSKFLGNWCNKYFDIAAHWRLVQCTGLHFTVLGCAAGQWRLVLEVALQVEAEGWRDGHHRTRRAFYYGNTGNTVGKGPFNIYGGKRHPESCKLIMLCMESFDC